MCTITCVMNFLQGKLTGHYNFKIRNSSTNTYFLQDLKSTLCYSLGRSHKNEVWAQVTLYSMQAWNFLMQDNVASDWQYLAKTGYIGITTNQGLAQLVDHRTCNMDSMTCLHSVRSQNSLLFSCISIHVNIYSLYLKSLIISYTHYILCSSLMILIFHSLCSVWCCT